MPESDKRLKNTVVYVIDLTYDYTILLIMFELDCSSICGDRRVSNESYDVSK